MGFVCWKRQLARPDDKKPAAKRRKKYIVLPIAVVSAPPRQLVCVRARRPSGSSSCGFGAPRDWSMALSFEGMGADEVHAGDARNRMAAAKTPPGRNAKRWMAEYYAGYARRHGDDESRKEGIAPALPAERQRTPEMRMDMCQSSDGDDDGPLLSR